jgi:hypothetical protein
MKKRLIEDCIVIFKQGENLLQSIENNDVYAKIGGHFRHCTDFVDCLFSGIESGKIDYNKRERNLLIETDIKTALIKISETVEKLQTVDSQDFNREILVRHEQAIDESDKDSWCKSTIAREVEFMQSHTVHHYAIIGLKLASSGIQTDENFGVADSTLKYREQRA